MTCEEIHAVDRALHSEEARIEVARGVGAQRLLGLEVLLIQSP